MYNFHKMRSNVSTVCLITEAFHLRSQLSLVSYIVSIYSVYVFAEIEYVRLNVLEINQIQFYKFEVNFIHRQLL